MDDISRRQFMEVVAASAAAGVVLPGSASAPASDVLSASQTGTLTAILNRLIPPAGNMPGAGDLGIAAFIQAAVAAAPHLRHHIELALTAASEVQASAQTEDHGRQLDAVLQRLEREQNESFDLLLQAAYTGYYSHPKVLAALRWVDPSDESQIQPPPFDVTLLAAVRRRAGLPDIV
jgi:hypothetical protein